tara:strand:+ start:125 stop:301 length:177 start_codon:yes stop_codon:yes gene_type:complete
MSYEQDDYLAIDVNVLNKMVLPVSGNTVFDDYEESDTQNALKKNKKYYIIKIVEIQEG